MARLPAVRAACRRAATSIGAAAQQRAMAVAAVVGITPVAPSARAKAASKSSMRATKASSQKRSRSA